MSAFSPWWRAPSHPPLAIKGARDGQVTFQPENLLSIYFDTQRSALNPQNVGYGFFVYGTFPLFAVRLLAGLFNMAGYDKVHLLGRALSAGSDLITVALVYAMARRLYGSRVALLSAALLAFCVMHIQQAHFFVFDSFLVTLTMACLYFCVDIAETGRLRSFAFAGVFLGLALATKLSMWLLVPIIALSAVIYVWRVGIRDRGLNPQTMGLLWSEGHLTHFVTGGVIAAGCWCADVPHFSALCLCRPGVLERHAQPSLVGQHAAAAQSPGWVGGSAAEHPMGGH